MPVVGNWTVPPERSASVYDKARRNHRPGYYSVYLDDFKTKAEMTAATGRASSGSRFRSRRSPHLLLDLGRVGGR